jgi:hypothetical protein
MFMNHFDIQQAISRHTQNSQPNRLGAALVVSHLAEWADDNSDGWAYWPKPRQAAARLTDIADRWNADSDVTDADLAAAVKPVKAFLTRQARETNRHGNPRVSPAQREQILRSVTA